MRKTPIETALLLKAINKKSAREKSIRPGHPSTLHLRWARRLLVVVGQGGPTPPRYLKDYAFGEPDFAETMRMFSLRKLLQALKKPA